MAKWFVIPQVLLLNARQRDRSSRSHAQRCCWLMCRTVIQAQSEPDQFVKAVTFPLTATDGSGK
jgi:hypothetical protein